MPSPSPSRWRTTSPWSAQVAHGAADVQQPDDAARRDLEKVGGGVGAAGHDARPVLGAFEAATGEDGREAGSLVGEVVAGAAAGILLHQAIPLAGERYREGAGW